MPATPLRFVILHKAHTSTLRTILIIINASPVSSRVIFLCRKDYCILWPKDLSNVVFFLQESAFGRNTYCIVPAAPPRCDASQKAHASTLLTTLTSALGTVWAQRYEPALTATCVPLAVLASHLVPEPAGATEVPQARGQGQLGMGKAAWQLPSSFAMQLHALAWLPTASGDFTQPSQLALRTVEATALWPEACVQYLAPSVPALMAISLGVHPAPTAAQVSPLCHLCMVYARWLVSCGCRLMFIVAMCSLCASLSALLSVLPCCAVSVL